MPVSAYKEGVEVDLSVATDLSKLAKKSVVITGGASGLGKAYASAFVKAGAFVTVADFDEKGGEATAAELGSNCQFVKCDVRDWDQQVAVFEAATSKSPEKGVDIVVANAGIIQGDDLFSLQDPSQAPTKPDLKMIEVNLVGVSYTAKLAIHYLRRPSGEEDRDRSLILKSSIAGYVDMPPFPQYNISKWGIRGLMRNLRRVTWSEGIRVNLVAPWYVHTNMSGEATYAYLQALGIPLASIEDCASAVLTLATRRDLNGKALGIMPRANIPAGVIDMDQDDFRDGEVLKQFQELHLQIAPRTMAPQV